MVLCTHDIAISLGVDVGIGIDLAPHGPGEYGSEPFDGGRVGPLGEVEETTPPLGELQGHDPPQSPQLCLDGVDGR
ncbi:hypothetical protein ACFC4R_33735, partial [[Kitasatospora] papulosa]